MIRLVADRREDMNDHNEQDLQHLVLATGGIQDLVSAFGASIQCCYERYLLQIRNNMLAPVEIVYGVPTWERTQNLFAREFPTFRLMGYL